ncbi:MAG: lysozyme inhibitor LprI family protein [Pseudomonadota bacterium]
MTIRVLVWAVFAVLGFGAGPAQADDARIVAMMNDSLPLSAMDEGLNKAYAAARTTLDAQGKASLLDEQRQWLARRNQCEDLNCAMRAYRQRLGALSEQGFGGWRGSFDSDLGLTLTIDLEAGGYTVSISGAGANFTCDGTFNATARGRSLRFVGGSGSGKLYPAGDGVVLIVPDGDLGACGARAPQRSAYYARQG